MVLSRVPPRDGFWGGVPSNTALSARERIRFALPAERGNELFRVGGGVARDTNPIEGVWRRLDEPVT